MTGSDTKFRKRFYTNATVAATAGGLQRIELDGRPIRTPGKREVALPTAALAEAVASEWRAQVDEIRPQTMPLTRIVNSALDGVADRVADVRADLVSYAGSDLLCYFAESPAELVERQSRSWAPIHAWAKRTHGIELELAAGIMPVEQDQSMLARFDAALGDRTPLELAGLHVVTTLTGSALLALALVHGEIDATEAWTLAHVDEDFQIEKWGADADAADRRAARWLEMQAAALLVAQGKA